MNAAVARSNALSAAIERDYKKTVTEHCRQEEAARLKEGRQQMQEDKRLANIDGKIVYDRNGHEVGHLEMTDAGAVVMVKIPKAKAKTPSGRRFQP